MTNHGGSFDILAGLGPAPEGGVYMDNNATTRVAPEVIDAMMPYLVEHYGNPSSMHRFGAESGRGLTRAREQVADLLGARATNEIIFTAGGSESSTPSVVATTAMRTVSTRAAMSRSHGRARTCSRQTSARKLSLSLTCMRGRRPASSLAATRNTWEALK